MNVRAVRVGAVLEVRKMIECVLGERSALLAMPESQRCPEWREELFQRIYEQEVFAYIPFDFGANVARPMGIYWGELCGAGTAFGHQFLEIGCRGGFGAVLAAKACARAFLRDFPAVSVLLGMTPEENEAAVRVAVRVGFRDMGRVVSGGVRCRLLAAERETILKGA